jgi:serine/threonine protein kinase
MSDIPINPDQLSDEDLPVDFGRYTLTKVLGEGGMARVFLGNLAGPQGFRKPCAIKVLHASVARRGEKFLMTLSNEARLGGLLNHPNVVNTYDFGNVGGQPFIAMEFIDGIGIDELLSRVVSPPIEVTLELAIQMCAGLEYAHNIHVDGEAGNLVHRDLKPSNVIVSRNGLVKVMDFGIAKASNLTGNLTGAGMTKGTPPFMSPEQMAAEELDRRSDIFALGSLVYEIATGKRLFHEPSISAVISSVMNVDRILGDNGRLDRLDAVYPPLKPILRRCLAPRPEGRYSSARALASDLKRLQRTLPLGDSLEDYVQAVLRGEVAPRATADDSPSSAAVTADVATPVAPLGTESIAIHFEESIEHDSIAVEKQLSASSGDEQDEAILEFVMEPQVEPTENATDDESNQTQLTAPSLGSGTVIVARTDSGLKGTRKTPTDSGERRSQGRGTRSRPPSRRARRFIKLAILVGLLIIFSGIIVFLAGDHSPAEDDSTLTDVGLQELHGTEQRDEATQGKESQTRKTKSSKNEKTPKQSSKESAKTASDSTASSSKSPESETNTPSNSTDSPKESSQGPRTGPETASSDPRTVPTGRQTESAAVAGGESTNASTSTEVAPTTSGQGQVRRILKMKSAPKQLFAGKREQIIVEIPNLQSGDEFVVKLRMQCAREMSENKWRNIKMDRFQLRLWRVIFELGDRDQGICRYFFEADPKGDTAKVSGKVTLGSRSKPYELKVR